MFRNKRLLLRLHVSLVAYVLHQHLQCLFIQPTKCDAMLVRPDALVRINRFSTASCNPGVVQSIDNVQHIAPTALGSDVAENPYPYPVTVRTNKSAYPMLSAPSGPKPF
jgi:hypothetical protein